MNLFSKKKKKTYILTDLLPKPEGSTTTRPLCIENTLLCDKT